MEPTPSLLLSNKKLWLLLTLVFIGLAWSWILISQSEQSDYTPAPPTQPSSTAVESSQPASEIPVAQSTETLNQSIYFLGDVMLARHVERLSRRHGLDFPYQRFEFSPDATQVVANFEAAVPLIHEPTPDFTFRFSVAEELLAPLREFGVTHVSLANNHSLDHGRAGYNNTTEALIRQGIISFGHPSQISTSSVAVLQLAETKIAVVGLMAIDEAPDYLALQELLANYSTDHTLLAYIHWGPEYQLLPSSFQQAVARRLIELGFDLIIGHHPHVVQAVERIDDVPVIYSLGNFIFDQYFSTAVQTGLVIKLGQVDNSLAIDLIGVTSLDSRSQPRRMTTEESANFFKDLSLVSDEGVRTDILKQRLWLPNKLATLEESAIMPQ